MRTTLRWIRALTTVLLCVAVVGACGGEDDGAQTLPAADDGDQSSPAADDGDQSRPAADDGGRDAGGGEDSGGGNGGGGARGIPAGGSSGGARGAPIDIPPLTQLAGLTIERVTEIMEEKIREVCGGDLCVVVETEVEGDAEGYCEYRGDPPEGTTVERGSTLLITAVCETDTETETEEETDTGSTTDTETDTGSEAETEGTT